MGEAYKTILAEGRGEFLESRSRFIGRAKPVGGDDEATAFIEEIQKQDWDATHHVWAYAIGASRERYSDGGEPRGTAGLPVLSVIRKEGLRDAVVVVTRYFGGVKLGAGGLVRAYTRGAKIALEAAGIIERRPYLRCTVRIGYPLIGAFQRELAVRGYRVQSAEYLEQASVAVFVPPQEKENLLALVGELTAGKGAVEAGPEVYLDLRLNADADKAEGLPGE